MPKATYRVVIRRDGETSDIVVTEPGRQPRIVKTFYSEAEAWEWIWKWVKEQKEERR